MRGNALSTGVACARLQVFLRGTGLIQHQTLDQNFKEHQSYKALAHRAVFFQVPLLEPELVTGSTVIQSLAQHVAFPASR